MVVGLFTGQNLGKMARKKLERSKQLRVELQGKADQVSIMVEEIRATVRDNRNSAANIDGCLIGSIDEYMPTFQAQTSQLLSMFDQTHDHWQKKIASSEADHTGDIAAIQAQCADLQSKIQALLSAPVAQVKLRNLSDMKIGKTDAM